METLAQRIERHEGRRAMPYRDSVGNETIGVGRNLANGLRDDEIDLMRDGDAAMVMTLGYAEWIRRFDDALKRYRDAAPGSDPRATAEHELRALGLSEGDILYWAARKPH